MEEKQNYTKKELEKIVINYLKRKTQIKNFQFVMSLLYTSCNIKNNVSIFNKEDINKIKSKIDFIGKESLYKIEKRFEEEVQQRIKKIFEDDNSPYSININIKLKNSKWWTQRRAYKHFSKIIQMLNGKNIEYNNVDFSYKKIDLFYEYLPKDNKEDLIEEYILSHQNATYKQIAKNVECSEDRVKQIAKKVFKAYKL